MFFVHMEIKIYLLRDKFEFSTYWQTLWQVIECGYNQRKWFSSDDGVRKLEVDEEWLKCCNTAALRDT